MSELNNIMRCERERTGNYGQDFYETRNNQDYNQLEPDEEIIDLSEFFFGGK